MKTLEHLAEVDRVSVTPDGLKIIALCYDILEVKKPRDIKFNSETIRIIKINDSIFLYPNKKEK